MSGNAFYSRHKMNQLENHTQLKNTYYGMRHGQSQANCEGLVVSTPENGIHQYGLSDQGRQQVLKSIKQPGGVDKQTRIYSSDFKRARETAELVHAQLACIHPIRWNAKLRERNFGDFELGPDSNYSITWAQDAVDGAHTNNNVESAEAVMTRVTGLVNELENQFTGETFLLVAHGDTLQILQAAFSRLTASQQRTLKHLETAEIRAFSLGYS